MEKLIRYLYIITIFFLFLPAFAFPIPIGGKPFRVLFIFLLLFYAICMAKNWKNICYFITIELTKKPFIWAGIWIIYLFASLFILFFINPQNALSSLCYMLQFFILYFFPCYFLSAYFIPKVISINEFLKIFFLILFFIFIFGIIEYCGKLLDITLIKNIQMTIDNMRYVVGWYPPYKRLQSVFEEPSWLGSFLFITFPIIYNCILSPYKIYKNKILNFVIKQSLIPLAWINLLCTFSPIWLIFCSIQALFIFRKNIINYIFSKKIVYTFIILFFILFLILIFHFLKILPSNTTQIKRILATISTFGNFNTFILVEPSLATRIISFINTLRIFIDNIFIGVGLNNAKHEIIKMLMSSPVPLTGEMSDKLLLAKKTLPYNGAMMYQLLAETGIIGTSIFFTFLFSIKNMFRKIEKISKEDIVFYFTSGLRGFIICVIIGSIYDIWYTNPYLLFMLGFSTCLKKHLKYRRLNFND